MSLRGLKSCLRSHSAAVSGSNCLLVCVCIHAVYVMQTMSSWRPCHGTFESITSAERAALQSACGTWDSRRQQRWGREVHRRVLDRGIDAGKLEFLPILTKHCSKVAADFFSVISPPCAQRMRWRRLLSVPQWSPCFACNRRGRYLALHARSHPDDASGAHRPVLLSEVLNAFVAVDLKVRLSLAQHCKCCRRTSKLGCPHVTHNGCNLARCGRGCLIDGLVRRDRSGVDVAVCHL